jgi:serine/threonine-protein kinase RsbW
MRLESADVEDLERIRSFVRDAATELETDDDLVPDLVIAVDEAAANIFQHGYRDHHGPIEVEIERRGTDVTIRLRDEAPPFDPTTWPTPDLAAPLARRAAGGLGIHLARSSVDRMHHQRRQGSGNELTLVRGSTKDRREEPA